MPKKKEDDLFSLADIEQDRWIFKKLQIIMTAMDRIWLLDCNGNYGIYHQRLRALATRYRLDINEHGKNAR